MRHDWLFEVLDDIKSYADRHGFVALSAKVDETIGVARTEVAAAGASETASPHPPPRENRN